VVLTDKLTFAQYLEQDLAKDNKELRIVNFGVSGIDSFSVKLRVEQALRYATIKPKLLLFYYGHNDCHAAYKSVVNGPRAPYGNLFNTFLRTSFYLSGGEFDAREQEVVFGTKRYEFFWYGLYHRPRYFNLAQKLGLWTIDNAVYQDYNRRILESFKTHTSEIVALARENAIPALFITPIGNLHAKPYGRIDIVEDNYEKGLATADYRKRLEYLTVARDNEIFTGDLRAKSELLDHLRTVGDGSTTFLFDLERDFIAQGFPFDGTTFLDYFHFNDAGHQKLAGYLAQKMRATPRIRESLKLAGPYN
jgi:lysophospholipase L1-like esterase